MSSAAVDLGRVLSSDNVRLREGAGRGVSMALSVIGLALIALTLVGGFSGEAINASIALSAFHIGFLWVVTACLGSLVLVMIFQQTNAGWAATVRRQFENIMSLMWVPALLFVGGVVMQLVLQGRGEHGTYLFHWMDPHHTAGDLIFAGKSAFLDVGRFYICAAVYFLIWIGLAMALYGYSVRQDEDGDKWHTARARKISSFGLLLFAISASFASFDWVMSLDYHWYSTMMGVWFFAGSALSAVCVATLVLLVLRYFGRLHVAFTSEHLHDLGKLMFAFTVFWAYISFSQYFLIWYANIPEETAWFLNRKEGLWGVFSWALPICHFIVPFIWLMARPARRKGLVIGVACIWLLVMHAIDLIWYVRPEAAGAELGLTWIDFVGIAGPVCLFSGLLIGKVAGGPLIPMKDPRLPEALHHKNYV